MIISIVAGGLCFCYFLLLMLRVGIQFFHFFFLGGAIGFFLLAWLIFLQKRGKIAIPKIWIRLFWSMAGIAMLCFCILLGQIIYGQSVGAKEDADYVIVLGAGLRGEKPSFVLQKRLNAAAGYLEENPASRVIVSGGRGKDEPVSEAEAMRRYLLQRGIEEDRIFMEDASENTVQNLNYSRRMIPDAASVVIVTNKFHVFRALHIARECGYRNVSGLGADNIVWLNPANYIRECFAVVKDVWL